MPISVQSGWSLTWKTWKSPGIWHWSGKSPGNCGLPVMCYCGCDNNKINTSCGAKAQQTLAASCGFSELTKNVIRSSHGHSTPSLKIWCKSVQPFARNVADKEISIASLCGFSELTQNWITSSHGHSTPSLEISCKSVQPFARNVDKWWKGN